MREENTSPHVAVHCWRKTVIQLKIQCHSKESDKKKAYLPGENNIEADGFSRLVLPPEEGEKSNLELQALELHASQEKHRVSKMNYEKIQSVHGGVLGHC